MVQSTDGMAPAIRVQDLDQYITASLPEDDALLEELSLAIDRTQSMFAKIPFRESADAWGYRVLDEEAERSRRDPPSQEPLSQSTASMIVAALLRGGSAPGANASSGFPWELYPELGRTQMSPELAVRVEGATSLLEAVCLTDGKLDLKSTTYGHNDILSLSWHYDIFRSEPVGTDPAICKRIVEACESALLERAKSYADADSSYLAICAMFRAPSTPAPADARVGDSSYILLRFVRCLKALEGKLENADLRIAMSRAAKRLRARLHDQLSLAEITDSRFDPAELAFCLEGLLHLKPEQVDYLLLDRVIQVLGRAQASSAYWRSETPIVIQQRGHVLFPIGVETARSILNSIALFVAPRDGHLRRLEVSSDHLRLLKRYWSWLKGRQTAIKRDGAGILHGWHSEHVNDASLVHTWETSQILEFLLAFRRILKAHIADRLLSLSRLDVRRPGKRIAWSKVVEEFEPYARAPHDIYARIGADFVDPRMPGSRERPRNWSMLLFGPPGTGKSTVAENMGDCLGVPVITVTVSDFLGEGETRMEARVKNIFTVIERQLGAIVLFDEMDQFLLDRSSELFREQDSVFQFLTPGMLTKFAKLRRAETVIFIIATNFEERIDPAIKRTGRVDQRYLVLPPDNRRRAALLRSLCAHVIGECAPDEMEQLLEASCLLAYTDIKNTSAAGVADLGELDTALRAAARNVRFTAMRERAESPSKGLEEELEALVTLIDEAHRGPVDSGEDWDGRSDFLKYIEGVGKDIPHKVHYDRLRADKMMSFQKPKRQRAKGPVASVSEEDLAK